MPQDFYKESLRVGFEPITFILYEVPFFLHNFEKSRQMVTVKKMAGCKMFYNSCLTHFSSSWVKTTKIQLFTITLK